MWLQGPFAKIECASSAWIGMKFSPDGKYLMVHDNAGVISVYDAFSYLLQCTVDIGGNVDVPGSIWAALLWCFVV